MHACYRLGTIPGYLEEAHGLGHFLHPVPGGVLVPCGDAVAGDPDPSVPVGAEKMQVGGDVDRALHLERGLVDHAHGVLMDIVVASAVGDPDGSARDGYPFGLAAYFHGSLHGKLAPVDPEYFPLCLFATVNCSGIRAYICIVLPEGYEPGVRDLYRCNEALVLGVQDMDHPGTVHHDPQATVVQGYVVAGVAEPLGDGGIHGGEGVGDVVPVLEPEEVEGGVVLLVVAFIEDEQLGMTAAGVPFGHVDAFKAGVL